MTQPAESPAVPKMSNLSFRLMDSTFRLLDFLHPHIDKRLPAFGIAEGMTVVDYGCGPGRYTIRFAALVGETGKVYAVDIHELAIQAVRRKIDQLGLTNVEPVLAVGYRSPIPDHVADLTCAIDMFFAIADPSAFLGELKRLTKKDGLLLIDDGHQSRATTKGKLAQSGHWTIIEESRDHLKCRPT
jgi:ubiquinone/menaquinone biosynthesis C-methylase UbiE